MQISQVGMGTILDASAGGLPVNEETSVKEEEEVECEDPTRFHLSCHGASMLCPGMELLRNTLAKVCITASGRYFS